MYDKWLKWSGIIGCCVLGLMIAGMLYYSSQKSLVYVQAEENQQVTVDSQLDDTVYGLIQIVPEEKEDQNKFYIPVSGTVTQESIRIENDYVNRRLKITISGMDTSFYEKNAMYGKMDNIVLVQAGNQYRGIVIFLTMERICEYEAVLENQKLGLVLKDPADVYNEIVVLDAGHGGSDNGIVANGITEAELCMEITELVKAKLETQGIRVYLTHSKEGAPDWLERASYANETGADLFLTIHLSEGADYGINAYYNDLYFMPGFNNVMFADILVREVAEAVNNRGNGVFAIEQEASEVLCAVEVPAARLEIGCPADAQEAELLKRADYKEDLAEGICAAIMRSLEEVD